MLTIKDLASTELLDPEAMSTITGGFDPFVYTGLRSMMEEMLGWPPLEKETAVADSNNEKGVIEPMVIKERNYREVTSS